MHAAGSAQQLLEPVCLELAAFSSFQAEGSADWQQAALCQGCCFCSSDGTPAAGLRGGLHPLPRAHWARVRAQCKCSVLFVSFKPNHLLYETLQRETGPAPIAELCVGCPEPIHLLQARAEPEAGPAPIAEGNEEEEVAGNKLDLAPAPTALDCSLITPNPLISVAGVAAAHQEADQLPALDEGGSGIERWAKHCFAFLLKAGSQAVMPGKAPQQHGRVGDELP